MLDYMLEEKDDPPKSPNRLIQLRQNNYQEDDISQPKLNSQELQAIGINEPSNSVHEATLVQLE